VRPTPLPTPVPTPAPTLVPTTAPTPVPTAVPEPVACADGIDNDGDERVDYPDDKGCRTADDLYEQRGKSWRRLLREMAEERGISRRQLRREIRGTEQEQRLIELGMPQR
jgi:hypothetical protein